jgi:hypothetical protein
MAVQEHEQQSSPSALDIAVRLVGAVTATIAAVRAVQGAMRAWQRVVSTLRGGEKNADAPGS